MKHSICTIDGCELMVRARGMCSHHYYEWRRDTPPEQRDRYPKRRKLKKPVEVDKSKWMTEPPTGTAFTIILTNGRPVHLNMRDLDRLEQSFTVTDDGCWEWQRVLDREGYAVFKVKSMKQGQVLLSAHRLAWSVRNRQQIPDGLTIDHLCRNRACINPDHLEPCEIWENTQRGTSPSVINQAKTHCIRGHELSGDNVYESPGRRGRPHRQCVTCRDEFAKERRRAELTVMKRSVEA